jgi:methylenetetrahydrofolate dehydrogenase (NADP+)/methenyltetrahydrofolate cyclohydrolase
MSDEIRAQVASDVEALKATGVTPKLVAVLAGEDPGARFYAGAQEKACGQVGIAYELRQLAADIEQADLEGVIETLNADASVHGILLLMPVPKGFDGAKAQALITPAKDVDGISPANLGRVVLGQPRLAPCTAMSVIELLKSTGVDCYGKEAVVIGSSEIVGKPAALLLVDKYITADADGETDKLAGAPGLISGEMVKEGAVVIDVATIRVKDEETGKTKTYGDVDFEAAQARASWITPVPGGVGVVTTAILLRNTLEACKWQLED